MNQSTSALLFFLTTFLLVVTLAVYLSTRGKHKSPVIQPVLLVQTAILFYTLPYLFQITSRDFSTVLFWFKISLPGATLLAPAILWFALQYNRRSRWIARKKAWLGLAIIPILACLLGWSNEFHNLFFKDAYIQNNGLSTLLNFTPVLYWVQSVYTAILLASGLMLLIAESMRRPHRPLQQSILILIGGSIPILFSLAFFMGMTFVNLTPFSLPLMAILWAVAVTRFGPDEMMPVAREVIFERMNIAAIVLDDRGILVDSNPASLDFFNKPQKEILGKTIEEIIPNLPNLKQLQEEGKKVHFQTSNSHADHKRFYELQGNQLYDPGNKKMGTILLLQDVTAYKEVEESLRESEQRLSTHLQNTPMGVIEWDMEHRVLNWNPAAEWIFGYSREEALNQPLHTLIFPQGNETDLQIFAEELTNAKGGRYRIIRNKSKDGRSILCEWFNTLTVNSNGVVTGFASLIQDITDRNHNEKIQRALYRISETAYTTQNLEELYKKVHEIIGELLPAPNFYIALYDPVSDTISFPYYADEIDENPGIVKRGRGLTEYVLRMGKAVLADPEVYRVLKEQGEAEVIGTPALDWMGVPFKTAQGKAFGVMALQTYTEGVRYSESDLDVFNFISTQVAQAIERKRAEEKLRQSEQSLRTMVENQGEGMVIADEDENLVFANPAADMAFGFTVGKLVGHNLREFLEPNEYARLRSETNKRIRGERSVYELEIVRKTGDRCTLLITASPQLNSEGVFTGTLAVMRDITDRKHMEQELLYKSTHDSLTELYNRAYFESELLRFQNGHMYPVSVLMTDMDGLKMINDRLGHAAGDEILCKAAGVLLRTFRSIDIVARIGGDEFAVLLPGISSDAAPEIIRRLQNRLIETNAGLPDYPISLSMGIATAQEGDRLKDVLKLADDRMYQAKAEKKAAHTNFFNF